MAPMDNDSDGAVRGELQPDTGHDDGDTTTEFREDVPRKPRRTVRAKSPRIDGGLSTPDSANIGTGPLPLRGRDASRSGCANGDSLRTASGRGDLERPNFNVPVGPNGYAWWYVDGLSDCGTRAISIIGFIGSVFSPWYRWSGRKCPQDNVCINVATYGPGGRFTMTDRGKSALRQTANRLEVGPSMMRWEDGNLVIDIEEVSSHPLISRIRGQVIVRPSAVTQVELPLTPDGAHIWRPFAPRSTIDVRIDRPGWNWSGEGYFDANFGTRALEEDFSYWTWGRFPTPGGATCFYDAERLDGTSLAAAFRFGKDGQAEEIDLPPKAPFRRSLWAVKRETRADAGYKPHQVQNMLDAPFYSRSAVKTRLDGVETVGVHEALDLRRFRSPLIKPMLAVRVPRRASWDFSRAKTLLPGSTAKPRH